MAASSDMAAEASSANVQSNDRDLRAASTSSLLRGWAVYSALSFPSFVDSSPTLLKISSSIPIVKQIAHAVVRNTFFKQFVGGETFAQTLPVIEDLREKRNVAALVDYSVEVDENAAKSNTTGKHSKASTVPYEQNIQELLSAISSAAEYENGRNTGKAVTRKTWVAIKLSALLPDAASLKNFSSALLAHQSEPNSPFGTELLYSSSIPSSMTEQDIADLKVLHSRLKDLADAAVKNQVRVTVDAEYTWYQPAIDAFATDLMQRSNSLIHASPVNPVIYLTFQAYLRSTPARLRSAFIHAASNGYVLGIKLVRGAYHPHETEHHEKNALNKETLPPVWSEKRETDVCYNECANLLLDKVARPSPNSDITPAPVGIVFGTHNKESCDLIIDGLARRGLATQSSNGVLKVPESTSAQVQLGQLFGMADELTNYVTTRLDCPGAPMVLKCIPYGKLETVLPYLGRRAIENKSVLGNDNTSIERQRLSKELKRRIFHRA